LLKETLWRLKKKKKMKMNGKVEVMRFEKLKPKGRLQGEWNFEPRTFIVYKKSRPFHTTPRHHSQRVAYDVFYIFSILRFK